MKMEKTYRTLAYLGALPFMACAGLQALDVAPLKILGPHVDVALTYGLVIMSFMAGTHWGLYLNASKPAPVNLFITSNAITIIMWALYLAAGTVITLGGFILGFLALLWIDYRLAQAGIITAAYYKVRVGVSALVVASLGLLMFSVES